MTIESSFAHTLTPQIATIWRHFRPMKACAIAVSACVLMIGSARESPAASHDTELLDQLARAETQWSSAGLTDYGYSLNLGGVFGYTAYKVRVRKGVCSASSRSGFSRSNRSWKRVGCAGITIPELFQEMRRQLTRGTLQASAEFDNTLGYVKKFSADPDTELTDQGWYVEVREFKSARGD